jgi:hypothetical protein
MSNSRVTAVRYSFPFKRKVDRLPGAASALPFPSQQGEGVTTRKASGALAFVSLNIYCPFTGKLETDHSFPFKGKVGMGMGHGERDALAAPGTMRPRRAERWRSYR